MGYGSQAMELLGQYYEMKIPNLDEKSDKAMSTEIPRVADERLDLLEETIGKKKKKYRFFFSNEIKIFPLILFF